MHRENSSALGNIDAGHAAIDREHHALARLIEKVGNTGEFPLHSLCDCNK